MDTSSIESILRPLIAEVEAFPPGSPAGGMRNRIQSEGVFEELGLRVLPEDLFLGQLYSGLTVLVRDMHDYLAKHPQEDAGPFEEAVSLVSEIDRRVNPNGFFPCYQGLPTDQVDVLPRMLAVAAAKGHPLVTPLGNPGIVHEWTFKPGMRLFKAMLSNRLCYAHKPRKFVTDALVQKPLTVESAALLILKGFSPSTFWIPLSVYLGVLLAKRGVESFCKL